MPINQDRMRLFMYSFFLLCSCSSSIKLPGNYSSKNIPYSFTLNPDSTFDYRYKFEFAYEHSQGKWKKAGRNEIVLTSYIQNKSLPLKVQYLDAHEIGQANFFSVNISMPDTDKNYYQCMIFINDTLYQKRNCDSIDSILITSPVRSIFFKLSTDIRMPTRLLDTLSTDKFIPRSSTANREKISIVLSDSLFNYRVFNKEALRVTRRGLRFYDSRGGQWQCLARRK